MRRATPWYRPRGSRIPVRSSDLRACIAPAADARERDLAPRRLRTAFGGLFLFVPDLVRIDLDRIVSDSAMPGSRMIPAGHAFRALLALKLQGVGRPPHVMADILDPGMALFAGLNVMASGLYPLLAVRVGNGKQNAEARTLFRNFIKSPADITIDNDIIDVRIGRRANNPFLLDAACDETGIAVPRLGNRRLRINFL